MQYQLNGISCDKLSIAVVAVRVHPEKNEKVIDTGITFLTQLIDKRAPTLTVKVASVTQTRPAMQQKTSTTCGTFKEKIELKKYFREEYDSMLITQHQQLHEFWKKEG